MKPRVILASAVLLATTAPVQAGTFFDSLVPDAQNTYIDFNRESVFDMDNSGTLNEGDILVGYLRLDGRSQPLPGEDFNNDELYSVFAQEITSINESTQGANTQWDLRLSALGANGTAQSAAVAAHLNGLTPGATWGNGDLLAVLYEDVERQFITMADTPDPNADGVVGRTVFDFVDDIAVNGDRALNVGITEAEDFWFAQFAFPTAAPDNPIDNLNYLSGVGEGDAVGNQAQFRAGLTIQESTGTEFARNVSALNPFLGALTLHDLTVANGQLFGANSVCLDDGGVNRNPFFSTNPAVCGAGAGLGAFDFGNGIEAEYYGFSSEAIFNVFPIQTPEPLTVGLMGIALFGLGVATRYRKGVTAV